ncbi:hypothetical protein CBR_g22040 [Chara braunii]|uniref:Uncharacterized protein n=1 Tax=Chara braunii TaxID=69332 RepID=A0A388L244_CHABU|nr:hypothetical protein CBR_g22040 [Chara braunii]|eukprot:GBG76292.1 hypothetical protein CBR_g22040 [Chara braunii]
MTILTRSQTAAMDQKAGESDEAYEARLAAIIAESKQRADAAAAARKKREAEADRLHLLSEEQRQKHEAAAAKAADEERVQRREVIFREEGALHAHAKDWQREAESGESVDYGSRVSHLLNRITDLLATCIAQQEDIHSLDHANKVLQQSVDQMLKRIQQLEQQVATANTSISPSDLVDHVNVLEIDMGTLKTGEQQLQQQICAAVGPSATTCETIAKFDGLPIFCDASKTDPIQWWRQFELKLDIHHFIDANRHAYLYSRSGGAYLTAAWKKRFQVEPPEHQAIDKLLTFSQNSMPSGDWISEFQRLASTPKLPMNFDGIKLYFIKRSCPVLQNALTQVAENLNTSEELFNKAAQIIVTNLAARKTGHSSTAGEGANQHRPKVVVVAAATPSDPSILNEAISSDEGDRLAAAQNGGRPAKGRGRGKPKTNTTTSSGPGQAAPAQGPWTSFGLTERGYRERENGSARQTEGLCSVDGQHTGHHPLRKDKGGRSGMGRGGRREKRPRPASDEARGSCHGGGGRGRGRGASTVFPASVLDIGTLDEVLLTEPANDGSIDIVLHRLSTHDDDHAVDALVYDDDDGVDGGGDEADADDADADDDNSDDGWRDSFLDPGDGEDIFEEGALRTHGLSAVLHVDDDAQLGNATNAETIRDSEVSACDTGIAARMSVRLQSRAVRAFHC